MLSWRTCVMSPCSSAGVAVTRSPSCTRKSTPSLHLPVAVDALPLRRLELDLSLHVTVPRHFIVHHFQACPFSATISHHHFTLLSRILIVVPHYSFIP